MNDTSNVIENLIIGAGPGGVQLAYCFERAGIPYQLIERGSGPGTFYRTFPRHRKMISINKKHTGNVSQEVAMRHDWNSLLTDDYSPLFKDFDENYFPSADSLVKYLEAFVEEKGIRVEYAQDVVSVSRFSKGGDMLFAVDCANGKRYEARRVIASTGYALENIPQFEGSEHIVPYSKMETDPAMFENKRVLIIGKGNSAFETGDNLVGTAAEIHLVSPSPLRLAWKTHYVGDLRAVNNNLLDTDQLKSQNSVQNAVIQKIVKDNDEYVVTLLYTKTAGETMDLRVDQVLGCTGFKFDLSIFDTSCPVQTRHNAKFPALTEAWESVSVPGLYFAGALMHSNDFRRSFSGFIHGFRYNVRALYHIIVHRYYRKPWRVAKLEAKPGAGGLAPVVKAMLDQVSSTSALFQLPGFLSFAYRIRRTPDGDLEGLDAYQEEMPSGYLELDKLFPCDSEYIKLTLEFGKHSGPDPFDANDDPNEPYLFLHPVARYCRDGAVLDEVHLPQNFHYQWNTPRHCALLEEWLHALPCDVTL